MSLFLLVLCSRYTTIRRALPLPSSASCVPIETTESESSFSLCQKYVYLSVCQKLKLFTPEKWRFAQWVNHQRKIALSLDARCLEKPARRNGLERQDRRKKRASVDGLLREEEGGGAMGWFLLGPIKKPVSSSVSKSLLWHSRQLRKHLKAPEKPDNTSLVECRVPLGGRRRDFAPCQ